MFVSIITIERTPDKFDGLPAEGVGMGKKGKTTRKGRVGRGGRRERMDRCRFLTRFASAVVSDCQSPLAVEGQWEGGRESGKEGERVGGEDGGTRGPVYLGKAVAICRVDAEKRGKEERDRRRGREADTESESSVKRQRQRERGRERTQKDNERVTSDR